jgi:hypothetical protein
MEISIILDRNYYKEYFVFWQNIIENNLKLNILRFKILLRDDNIGECKYIYNKKYKDEDWSFNKYYVFNWL